jgi:hypothetical protein
MSSALDLDPSVNNPDTVDRDWLLGGRILGAAGREIEARPVNGAGDPPIGHAAAFQSLFRVRAYVRNCINLPVPIAEQDGLAIYLYGLLGPVREIARLCSPEKNFQRHE